MDAPVDLDRYAERIGYDGPREPTLALLRALHDRHVRAIPFENLDVLLGRRILLDPGALERKLVGERRGGYCFEQNSLFRDVLVALGFAVTPLLARVRWGADPGVRTPLTHMVLRVEAEGRSWLADVGFGVVGPTAPLALDTEAEQATPHEARRLRAGERGVTHQMRTAEGWTDLYELTLEEPAPRDFELGNWYSSTHPDAHFRGCLVVSRADEGRRLTILDRELSLRALSGRTERRPIASPEELLVLLEEHFGLRFPAGTRFGPPGSPWPS